MAFLFSQKTIFFSTKKKSLFRAQSLYSQYMRDLDEYLAPPYADYYKIQQGTFFQSYLNIVILKILIVLFSLKI